MTHKILRCFNKLMSIGGRGWIYYIIFFMIVLSILIQKFSISNSSIPVILTMDSLGYENSITENVNRRAYKKEINLYELRIANTKDTADNNYQFINVKLYDTNDVNSAEKILLEEMLSIKKIEQEWLSECKGNCISFNSLKNIDMDKDFISLDADEWNVEKAYALYDYESYPHKKYYRNYVFLLKQNRVLVLEFSISFPMTLQRIKVLKDLIDADIF